MQKSSIVKFLLITFLVTWLLWGTIVIVNQFGLLKYGTPLFMVLFVIGGQGPPIAAYCVLKEKDDRKPFKSFLKWVFDVKQPLLSYCLCIFLVFIFFFMHFLLGILEMGLPFYMSLVMIPPMMLLGGLEEIGWRGFLQPSLEKKYHLIVSTVIVAVVWSIWHLPLWFIEGSSQYGSSFLCFSLMALGLSFSLTAIRYITKSVFLCILYHTLFNAFFSSFRPILTPMTAIVTIVEIAIALVVIAIYRRKSEVPQVTSKAS